MAVFTDFLLLIIRSFCVHGLGPRWQTSRCDVVCSCSRMQVMSWSPYPHFLIFSLVRPTPTRSLFSVFHTGQSKLLPEGYLFAGSIYLLPLVSVISFFHSSSLFPLALQLSLGKTFLISDGKWGHFGRTWGASCLFFVYRVQF